MAVTSEQDIPYPSLAEVLFPTAKTQKLIPFLGAGVSISSRIDDATAPPPVQYPSADAIQESAAAFGLTDAAKVFFMAATLLACHMQSRQEDVVFESAHQILERLKNDPYPPSSADLALLFSRYSNYTSFNEVVQRLLKSMNQASPTSQQVAELLDALGKAASLTSIGWPPDPLSTIAAYFERQNSREDLWTHLRDIITNKERPTKTHELLAKAASWSLAPPAPGAKAEASPDGHYLILTTNYDELMERALDAATPPIPYVVLTNKLDETDPQNPFFVTLARFSAGPDQVRLAELHPPAACSGFKLSVEVSPRVLVYKMHGSLGPDVAFTDEGLVISDNDYITFISQKEAIPANVKLLIKNKPLFFLGYSLNDWNVRSMFESMRRQRPDKERKGRRDLCVNRRVKVFERLFFEKNDIDVYETDLTRFATRVLSEQSGRGGP